MAVIGFADYKLFEEYYEKYYNKVFGYIMKKLGNTELAEDFTMDVFTVCWEKFSSFDPEKASFQTWVFVIVNNKLKNYYRDRKEYDELDEGIGDISEYQNEIDEAMQLSYLRERLADALETLSETHRQIIIYKYFREMTSNEIGDILGISPGNVRIQLKRAMDKVKEYFVNNNIRWE